MKDNGDCDSEGLESRKRYFKIRYSNRRIDSCPRTRPCVKVGVKEKI